MNFEGYCMRVQAMDGYAERIRMLNMTTDYQAIIAVKHFGSKGENEHYHIVIKTSVKDQAFRVRMKKVFDKGKGNAHMSIKPWDGNIDALSYLFHEDENAEIIARHNVTDETIEKARERNREVQVKMEQAKSRASWTIETELLEHYIKTKQSPTLHEIARDIVLHALRMDKYVPNDFLLKAMSSKIQFKLLDGDQNREQLFASEYVARVYRLEYHELQALAGGGWGLNPRFQKPSRRYVRRMYYDDERYVISLLEQILSELKKISSKEHNHAPSFCQEVQASRQEVSPPSSPSVTSSGDKCS